MQTTIKTIKFHDHEINLVEMTLVDQENQEGKPDFYDLFSETGEHLNLGDPFYEEPSEKEVLEYVEAFYDKDLNPLGN